MIWEECVTPATTEWPMIPTAIIIKKKKSGVWSYASPPQLMHVLPTVAAPGGARYGELQVPSAMQVKATFHSKILL